MNSNTRSLLPEPDQILIAIRSAKKMYCRDYARVFGERSTVKGDGWYLLQQIFNLHFTPSKPMSPFGPMLVADGMRSMIPDDLSDEQLDAISLTLEGIEDPEYRSRICDILWLRRKDPNAARLAVEAYLEAGKRVEHPEHWTSAFARYERAVRLARQIAPKGDLPKTALSHLESRVFYYNGTDPLYFTSKALELLAEFRVGNFVALAEIAGRVAIQSREKGDFRRARTYYDVQAKHLKLGGAPEQVEAARVESARTFVEEAEVREIKDGYTSAHASWANAIAAFRDRESLRSEIPELQQRYTAAGQALLDEMQEISGGEFDISTFVEESHAAVQNLPWEDAFFEFLSFIPLIDPEEIKRSTEEDIAKHPLQGIAAANIHDASGRKVAVRPPAITDNEEQYKRALIGWMEENARIHRRFEAHAHIAPAFRQIVAEHEIDRGAISNVLAESPLVPIDRLDLICDAFVAGFRGDLPTALHVLIPQIENSLRTMLEQHGISPANIDSEGVEEVWGFERILNHQKTKEILGNRFRFELNSLLVERMGSNFRNLLAHGLLNSDDLSGEGALYLWWLILRLCATPTQGMQAFLERKKAESAP